MALRGLVACATLAMVAGYAQEMVPSDTGNAVQAEWAELRGPVQSCGMKAFPGVKAFVRHTARQYSQKALRLVQRVTDPFLELYVTRDPAELLTQFGIVAPERAPEQMRRQLVARHALTPDHSEQDLVDLLASHGIFLPEHMTQQDTGTHSREAVDVAATGATTFM